MKTFSRRHFLRGWLAASAGAALAAAGCGGTAKTAIPLSGQTIAEAGQETLEATDLPLKNQPSSEPTLAASQTPVSQKASNEPGPGQAYLAVAHGEDPEAITRAALNALGGMQRFVKSGQDVIIKPNICVDYHTYEYAATTNPAVVGALVAMCLEAGAKRVRVMDNPFGGTADSAYVNSGISEAVKAAGGQMEIMGAFKFVSFDIPEGKDIQAWDIYRSALECDVLINVPIAKHHSLARLTLGGKNLLGLVAMPDRIHYHLGERIADLYSLIRPALTVVDAYRILMNHGPTGGSLDDVKLTQTVIASHDLVTTDAYGATLFGLKGEDIAYTAAMAARNLGAMDLTAVKIEEINV